MQEKEALYKLFQEAFHEHYSGLCRYANTLLNDVHDAEDIVQETFLRIWDKKSNLIGTAELRHYLYIAVKNNCLTRLSQKKKLRVVDIDINDAIDQPFTDTGQEPVNEANALVKEALNLLPPKCREVFTLSRISNHKYQEIAQILGISIKTVENQMGKAIKILRDFIKNKHI